MPFRLSSSSRKKSGFTLIELLVVIAIIALLAAILFPAFSSARESARRSSCSSNLRQIGMGLQQYIQDYDDFLPPNDDGAGGNDPFQTMQPYIKSTQVYICPSATEATTFTLLQSATKCTYSINNVYFFDSTEKLFEKPGSTGPAVNSATIAEPTNTIFVGDSVKSDDTSTYSFQVTDSNDGTFMYRPATDIRPITLGSSSQGQFAFRHNFGCNFVFFDGHVKWLKLDESNKRSNTKPDRDFYFTRVSK